MPPLRFGPLLFDMAQYPGTDRLDVFKAPGLDTDWTRIAAVFQRPEKRPVFGLTTLAGRYAPVLVCEMDMSNVRESFAKAFERLMFKPEVIRVHEALHVRMVYGPNVPESLAE